MVILMSDKPINAMYGQKVKLDLDKLKKKTKTEDKEIKEPVVETKAPEPVVEEPVVQEVEESAEEVVDEYKTDYYLINAEDLFM